jgi:MFS family permease
MNRELLKGFVIVSLSSLFYLFMFFVRVLPSVMTEDLMRDLAISSSGVGLITMSFVIAYALVQIPSGLLIDRLGAKKMILIGMTGCCLGSYLFQVSESLVLTIFSRVILGISCGAAFIAPMALVKQWLPKHMFSTAAGAIQFLGCLGAMLSFPISSLVSQYGWRDTGAYSVILAGILIIIFYFFIQERAIPDQKDHTKPQSIRQDLTSIITDRRYWHIGLIAMSSWTIIGGFAESWGVTYLSRLENISTPIAAGQMTWIWIGVAVSSPLAGFWAEHTRHKSTPIITMFALSTIALMLIISGYITSPIMIILLLFLSGASAGGQPIAFGLIADITPPHLLATAVSFCNVCVIAGAFAIQPIVSIILDTLGSSTSSEGFQYSTLQHQISFIPILVVMIIGIIASTYISNLFERTNEIS